MQVKNAINHHLKAMDVNDIYVNHVELVDQVRLTVSLIILVPILITQPI